MKKTSELHTPGTWYCPASSQAVYKDVGDRRHRVCDVDDWGDETAANARLIAAAPELLKLLKRLANIPWIPMDRMPDTKREVLAAIAKAEGRL